MKRGIESEYLTSVAKRTRARTEKYLVAKLEREAAERNQTGSVGRCSDVVVVDSDEEEDEVDRDREVRSRRSVRGKKKSGFGAARCEVWFDELPDIRVLSGPGSVGDDGVPDIRVLGEEGDAEEEERVRKEKEKGKMVIVVEEDEFVDRVDVGVAGSEEESESVRDNDGFNCTGNGGCLGRKDADDNSIGSRIEIGSASRPAVGVEEAVSCSCSGNAGGNENGGDGDGNGVVFSSEEEPGTEVTSSDSEEDDDSDENFDVNMADVSCSSVSASESDEGFVEEFDVGFRGRQKSCSAERNENASPCSSDDVKFLYELDSKKEILDENFVLNENVSYENHVSLSEESVENENERREEVGLSAPVEVEISGDKMTPNERVCNKESTPIVEELPTDGNKESPNKDDMLDEQNFHQDKGIIGNSAPTVKGSEAHRTKVDESTWTVCEEKSKCRQNKVTNCFGRTIGSAENKHKTGSSKFGNFEGTMCEQMSKNSENKFTDDFMPTKDKPKVETTSAWAHGTVRSASTSRILSGENACFVEPVGHTGSSMVSQTNKNPFANVINGGAGKSQGVEDILNKETSAVKSVPHIISTTRSSVKPENVFTCNVSKTMTNHGEDLIRKERQQEVHERMRRKPIAGKRARTWEKLNVFDILFNSLTSKKDAVYEDIVNASNVIQQDQHAEPVAPKSCPLLKFSFGVEAPVQREKTEFEQDLENLWDEFHFGLRTSEIGYLAHEKVITGKDTSLNIEKIHPNLCNRGAHKFILDDEIGIKCQICSFVQLEMKYVMPNWAKPSPRKFDRRASSDDEDPEVLDGMQFQDINVGKSGSCSDGTVWDLIPGVKDKLFPHQQDGFEFIWLNLMGSISLDELQSSANNGMGGCIISHAPGTGKTRLTLEFLHSYLELFPRSCPLIIAPAGMLLTWEAEFKKWDVGIPFHNLNSLFLSGKEDTSALSIFNASKQSVSTPLLRLLKLLSWTRQTSILGISYSLFEKLAGQRFGDEKESKSGNKKVNEQAKEFGKIILESAGLLVLDEGHTPRNPRSRIYKALTNIQTKKRIILSGTPFQNNLAELYTILSFVRPDFAQTISPELRKFCQRKIRMVNVSSGRSGPEPDVDRDDREAISQLRFKIDPFVHVHKGSVLEESLPGLKDCVMVLNPPRYQKHIVEMIESGSYSNFQFEHKLSLGTIHPSLLLQTEKHESFIDKAELEARRLDPNEGVKTKFLFEMIRLSEANNEKVLVFSQYLDPLGLIKDQICSLLHWREGKEVLQLVGSMESEQRQSIIRVFNDSRSSAKVLLASTKACSEGINLVGASRVVLLDVVWNPSVERQAISRAFRLGQKKVVYSYNLIVGRMEWEKYGAQTNKEHVSNLVFSSSDEPEKRSRVLSEDKILEELISHSSMEDMFDQIVYHPKDSLFS